MEELFTGVLPQRKFTGCRIANFERDLGKLLLVPTGRGGGKVHVRLSDGRLIELGGKERVENHENAWNIYLHYGRRYQRVVLSFNVTTREVSVEVLN